MGPGLESPHGANCSPAHMILLRHLALRKLSFISDRNDLSFGQNVVLGLFSKQMSSLGNLILNIIQVSSLKKMRRAHASPVVATMANDLAIWNRFAKRQHPCDSVNSKQRMMRNPKDAVTSLINRPIPFPTSISEGYKVPKSLKAWCILKLSSAFYGATSARPPVRGAQFHFEKVAAILAFTAGNSAVRTPFGRNGCFHGSRSFRYGEGLLASRLLLFTSTAAVAATLK